MFKVKTKTKVKIHTKTKFKPNNKTKTDTNDFMMLNYSVILYSKVSRRGHE